MAPIKGGKHLNDLKRVVYEDTMRLRLLSGARFAEFGMVTTSHVAKSSEVNITF